jgi:nitrite reductase/ring-hydroxylating ferredoxin subunit/uncharacterized membrane protein
MPTSAQTNDTLVPQQAFERIEQQHWLDRAAEPLSTAVRGAYHRLGPSGQQAKDALHGIWLGHPLHPVLTDIPIGAWMTSAVLDAAETLTHDRGYGRAADVAIGFGLAGAIGAAASGLTDWSETDGEARRLGLVHGLLNLTATTLYATAFAMRRNGGRAAGRAFGLAGLLVACTSSYLGGGLVYRNRIGVTHAEEPQTDQPVQVLASAALTEGDKKKVQVAGTDVVILRHRGRVCALAEHCSHLGGPLSEGTLTENGIVCPWHGSEFDVTNGRVIHGPATHPQPRLKATETNGEIFVSSD